MLTDFLPFLGLVIGASLQYFFTRHIENQRHIRDLRSKAYMDYLKTVSESAIYNPKENSKERVDLMAKTADAKSRICLYGSKKAIHAFSRFEELGAKLNTKDQHQSFTDMVGTMRLDSGSEIGVEARALQIVLLGVGD
ncbi:MAG: hypothetical protein NUV50_06045 [Rhodospirillales bacterium]|nr:hypothetical protein [Rhodospirillales bacterium]